MSTNFSLQDDSVSNKNRVRKAVVPPKKVSKEMSVFEYLARCSPPLERKIADIACSQTAIPQELREDAVQEIYVMWSNMRPDTLKYKPGQVASYAHHMARHAALRLRREIGSATCLPGSAFRKRRDGSSYVTPGVLATPVDWNELESWFQADSSSESGLVTSALMESELASAYSFIEEASERVEDPEEEVRKERLAQLESIKGNITERQYKIGLRLIDGATFDEVQAELGIKKGILMRELNTITSLLS